MMNYEDFCNTVAEEIREYLPEEYDGASIELKQVVKNNDNVLTGISITKPGQNICPNIYLDRAYKKYADEDVPMEEILEELVKVRMEHEKEDFDPEIFSDWSRAKNMVTKKLLNKEKNAEYLANKPYSEFCDLAAVYVISLPQFDGADGGMASVTVTNELLRNYGITVEELETAAKENMAKTPPVLKTMRDTLLEMMGDVPDFLLPPEEETPQMLVLTNERKCNGASVILDETTMKNISERLGGDYMILPSSIHELILLPGDQDTEILVNMVNEVNETQVAPEEVLSGHVYKYDAAQQKIVIAA